MIDYVFPEKKLFPIIKPTDVKTAVESYKLFQKEVPYLDFCIQLTKLVERKGGAFLAFLPNNVKRFAGIKKENSPESSSAYQSLTKKRPSRFIKWETEEFDDV